MSPSDTIAAISSAVGPAPRMIVRMSGRDAHAIARAICDVLPPPSVAARVKLRFASMIVPAWACLFAEGRSYTGEASIEFHIPGNPLLARMLLDTLVHAGARQAEPGEFTARAYFNGRIGLTEAEGVAATIAAHSEQELRAARQLMSGELSRRLVPIVDQLVQTLALVEAGIDFSDEDISFIAGEELQRRLTAIDASLDDLLRTSARFQTLSHEPTFVLVGRPNAGKSTLLNALAGRERAVVSPIEGTTRDILSAEVRSKRGLIRLIDAAGLEASAGPLTGTAVTSSPSASIFSQMQQQVNRALETADHVVLVRDITDARPAIDLPRPAEFVVRTKCDLAVGDAQAGELMVSAQTGQGMSELLEWLDRRAFGDSAAPAGATLTLNARHIRSIDDAREALKRVQDRAAAPKSQNAGTELIAADLRNSLDSLGNVLGQVTPDDVLGQIFASFCIGK